MNDARRTQRSSDPAAACLSRLERFAERQKTEHLFELQILKCQASRKRFRDGTRLLIPDGRVRAFMCLDEARVSRLKLGRTILCHKKNSRICVFIHTDINIS